MAHYKISDVAEEVKDRENNPSESKYDRFVGLEHYVSGDVEITHFGSTERLESAMKVFKAGDILIARRNVYLKRASTVSFDGLTSGDSIVLRAKDPTIARILPFVLNTDDFWDYADQYSDGTMSKRLSPKLLLAYCKLGFHSNRECNTLFFIVFPSECFSGRREIFRLGLRFDCRWIFTQKCAKIGGR